MKYPVAITLAVLLMAGTASAQYVRAKQMARDVNNKVTQRSNGIDEDAPAHGSPASGAAKPATPAAPQPVVAPIKPSTQQQAATKLKADIAEARLKGEVTGDMKKQFALDLMAAVMGHNRPSVPALTKFGDALLAAAAAKNVSGADDAKLVKAIVVSLNSAGLSSTRLQELNDEVQGVLTKAGVPAGDAALVGQNLGGVTTEIQSGTK